MNSTTSYYKTSSTSLPSPSIASSSSRSPPPPSSSSSRFNHPYLKDLRVTSSAKDSFILQWQVLPEIESLVDGFSVRYRASGSSIVQYSGRLENQARALDIGHLHENTDYEVCLWALFLSTPIALLSSAEIFKNLSYNLNHTETLPLLEFEEMQNDPVSYKNGWKVFPYCLETATGSNGAWVALGSALAATIVIGLIVFVVFLASCQNNNKKANQKSNNSFGSESCENDRATKKKKKWWLVEKKTGRCLLTKGRQEKTVLHGDHRPDCKLNCSSTTLKCGFLTRLKRKKRKGFRLKNQLQSSKSVLGCRIGGGQVDDDQVPECSCGQKHKRLTGKSKRRHGDILFGGRDDNSTAHSSLLSLIQDEPGSCYLVATANTSHLVDNNDQSVSNQQVTHELAYLIPIMKCQDGTFVLNTDPAKTEGLDLPLTQLIQEELYEFEGQQDDLDEPFNGDFDLLSVVFHPELCLSVIDSVFVGDEISIDDGEVVLPVVSEKMKGNESLTLGQNSGGNNRPMKRSSSFANRPMPTSDV